MMIGPDPMMRMERRSVRRGTSAGIMRGRSGRASSVASVALDPRKLGVDLFALLRGVGAVSERELERLEDEPAVARVRDPSDRAVGAVVERGRGNLARLAQERERAIPMAEQELELAHDPEGRNAPGSEGQRVLEQLLEVARGLWSKRGIDGFGGFEPREQDLGDEVIIREVDCRGH